MKIKSVFFVTNLNSGGIENYLLRFLKHYSSEISATVICKSGIIGEDLRTKYQEQGVTIIALELKYFNFYQYIQLYKYLKTQNFDSICDFTGNFAALTLLVAKKVGILKRVVFYRGSTNHFKEDYIRLTYNKLLNKLIPLVATSILSNSKAALSFFFKEKWKSNPKFEVVYNGIDANTFLSDKEDLRDKLGIPKGSFVVGHVGRYNIAKNHNTIILVAIELCKQDKDIYFVICGDKVDTNLTEQVVREKLGGQIKLLGYKKDVIKVLNTLDCFYFPSITEGQPNALLEALIIGLPFVASNIEPIKETIPVAFHSQLVNYADVAKSIEKIIDIKMSQSYRESLNLSQWAIEFYNPNRLFMQFYKNL